MLALPRGAAGQAPPPLDKAELVRLLTDPLFAQAEVADVVRRSCLTFRPTDRDWADLRSAGAGGEVIASAAACDGRRVASAPSTAPADEPVQPMTAVALPADIITTAGTASSVRVRLSRGRTPIKRVTLALKGTTTLGLSRDDVDVRIEDAGELVARLRDAMVRAIAEGAHAPTEDEIKAGLRERAAARREQAVAEAAVPA